MNKTRAAGGGVRRAPVMLICILLVILVLSGCTRTAPTPPSPTVPRPTELTLPDGFTAQLVADGLDGPTQMIAGPDGRLWVAQLNGDKDEGKGQVLSLNPETGARRVQLDGLYQPTGIAVHSGVLWIASGRDLWRADIGADASVAPPDPVLTDLPSNERANRTLTITPHGELVYATSGSHIDDNAAPGSATLWALTPQIPTDPRPLATGLQGAYGHTVDAQGRIWATDIGGVPISDTVNGDTVNGDTVNGDTVNGDTVNGDTVNGDTVNGDTVNGDAVNGDRLPPGELNLIVVGADFGWPQCVGDREPVPRYGGTADHCAATRAPVALFPPGSMPTSIATAPWDERILLVALWNTGEVVQVKITPDGDNAVGEISPFLTGLRHPQHLLAWRDGSLLISDFATGSIFRIVREQEGEWRTPPSRVTE